MIDSSSLLSDLKVQLKLLEADLRARAEDRTDAWGRALRAEYDVAFARGRTSFTWTDWRDGEVTLSAVAWIIACTFIRFAEDNDLLAGARDEHGEVLLPWITGPGVRRDRAVENQTAFHARERTTNNRDWLHSAFTVMAAQPAGRALLDPRHSQVWTVPISGEAADNLLTFWRRTDASGDLVHDFTDTSLDTRFLGDLYQDLSDYAKKTFALLQTPVFVEEFILDRTLTPAIAEFGLEGLKLIDPTCGSGHFLLGAFDRLDAAWQEHAPGLDARARVQKALDSIHGVDLNPFAVAIARFRLTVVALRAAGERSLVTAPAFGYHLAIGDSLLRSEAATQRLDFGDEGGDFTYSTEDVLDYAGILDPGQYHVVVGNPPYITVKDNALNKAYRERYATCRLQYALSVPFMELFFELARRANGAGAGAGYVGKITSNSFMKREFGKAVIELFLSGVDIASPVDLTHVVDTSGAYIPGHGTPTVILFGRRRRPSQLPVRAALGVRGEPSPPPDPARGRVWSEIIDHIDHVGFNGTYVTIADLPRDTLAHFPWSLTGGGASELLEQLNTAPSTVRVATSEIGRSTHTGLDEAFFRPVGYGKRHAINEVRTVILGEEVRDFELSPANETLFPYDTVGSPVVPSELFLRELWPLRTALVQRRDFGQSPAERGLRWFDHSMFFPSRFRVPLGITFAFVATHNHFVLDRGGKVFKQSAPVIKLPEDATEDDHFDLLGILNSSTACFWLKQVSHNKGSTVDNKGARQTQVPWEDFYEFTATKLKDFPLPPERMRILASRADKLARALAENAPARLLLRGSTESLKSELTRGREAWERSREQLVGIQEEIDWAVYYAYGLTRQSLTSNMQPELQPQQRAFEIALARSVESGEAETAWFGRHHRDPITKLPGAWLEKYRELVEKRLAEIESNPWIRLLEKPEFKRRWAGDDWEDQLPGAIRGALLEKLEAHEFWLDAAGKPGVRSVSQLAQMLKGDSRVRELAQLLIGSSDVDYAALVTDLLDGESVPTAAVQRYKPAGVEKFREWQRVWDLQRAEDRGERVTIPVPPKYRPTDFQKTTYWKARGKLDVPKERFLSYPGAALSNDSSAVYGWAGWDNAERGQAVLGLASSMNADGASTDALMPLFASLLELEPWLRQWHGEVDPAFGTSPADAIVGVFEDLLVRNGLSRDSVAAWQPPTTTHGRGRRGPKPKVASDD